MGRTGRTPPSDIDLELCTIRVDRQLIEQLGGGSAFGPSKSRAGKRAVPFSDIIRADLREHLERFASEDDEALVFTSPDGYADAAQQLLPPCLAARSGQGRPSGCPLSRLAAYRKHPDQF